MMIPGCRGALEKVVDNSNCGKTTKGDAENNGKTRRNISGSPLQQQEIIEGKNGCCKEQGEEEPPFVLLFPGYCVKRMRSNNSEAEVQHRAILLEIHAAEDGAVHYKKIRDQPVDLHEKNQGEEAEGKRPLQKSRTDNGIKKMEENDHSRIREQVEKFLLDPSGIIDIFQTEEQRLPERNRADKGQRVGSSAGPDRLRHGRGLRVEFDERQKHD